MSVDTGSRLEIFGRWSDLTLPRVPFAANPARFMLATRHFCQIIRGKSDVADRLLQALPSGNNGNRETATPRDLRSATALPNLGKWEEKQPGLSIHFDSVRENLFQDGRKRIHGTTVKWIP